MVSESFGEYPFQVEIAPKAVFSEKVALMLWSLLSEAGEPFDPAIKPLARLQKPRYRKRLCRTVISAEERYTRWIIGGFAWSSTIGVFAALVMLLAVLTAAMFGLSVDQLLDKLRPLRPAGLVLGFSACIALLIYGSKVLFSFAWYFAARHKFQRTLLRVLRRPRTTWQRLSLLRLLILRIGTLIVACLCLLYLMLVVLVVVAASARPLLPS
jgi:hypothetical protein